MEDKCNKKTIIIRIIMIILVILLVVFCGLTLRKFLIFSNIEKISKDKINSTNYYIERVSKVGDSITLMKLYNKDENYISESNIISTDNNDKERKIIIYKNNDEKISIIQSGEDKIAFTDSETLMGKINLDSIGLNGMSTSDKLLLSVTSKITSEEYNDKECYVVEPASTWKLWIDKETGLVIREENGMTVQDNLYRFDEVTDEDMAKPDMSDCRIQ